MPLSVGDGYSVAEFHRRINSYARDFAPSWRYLLAFQTVGKSLWQSAVFPLHGFSLWGEDVESV